jgi:light-regulated signal transduction histidine kinase (bacteriophytochrome)
MNRSGLTKAAQKRDPAQFLATGVGGSGESEPCSRERLTELEATNARLKAANMELEAYSFSIAHDLRAPLRRMAGFAKILQRDFPELPPEAQHQIGRICENAVSMGNLVTGLLDFSSLNFVPLTRSTVKPESIVREIFGELHSDLEVSLVDLKLDALPPCKADPMLLRRIYFNLLSNAVKYSHGRHPAVIRVGWRKEKDEGFYFVQDNGAGFDMQYSHKLFHVFERCHRQDQFEGTGVGLAIVQRIVQRHGGRIWAEGVVDGGATFYFSIPEQKEGADGH